MEKFSDDWLFKRHPKERIFRWVNKLKYFHFKRPWGRHANDEDKFCVAVSFMDESDLI